jgi:hypothetical protein
MVDEGMIVMDEDRCKIFKGAKTLPPTDDSERRGSLRDHAFFGSANRGLTA